MSYLIDYQLNLLLNKEKQKSNQLGYRSEIISVDFTIDSFQLTFANGYVFYISSRLASASFWCQEIIYYWRVYDENLFVRIFSLDVKVFFSERRHTSDISRSVIFEASNS